MFQQVQVWTIATVALVLVATLPLLLLARSRTTGSALSWASAICIAVLLTGTGAACLLPGLAEFKSVHRDVASKTHEMGFENVPILYFGVSAHGSSFALDEDDEAVSIDNEDYHLALQFLEDHPKTILVTSRDNAKSLTRNLMGVVELIPEPGQKKLYSARVIGPFPGTAHFSDPSQFK